MTPSISSEMGRGGGVHPGEWRRESTGVESGEGGHLENYGHLISCASSWREIILEILAMYLRNMVRQGVTLETVGF